MILPTLEDDEDHPHAHVVDGCVWVAEVVELLAIVIVAVAPGLRMMRTQGGQLCCFGCHGCWRRQKVETVEAEVPVQCQEVGE